MSGKGGIEMTGSLARRVRAAARLIAGLGLALLLAAGAHAGEPLKLGPDSPLDQRVLTRPGAILRDAPGAEAVKKPPVFSTYYVFAREDRDGTPWLELGADQVFAWPTAEIAVMGAEGAASVVFKREIDSAEDPDAKRAELVQEYRDTFSTPFVAASRGLVDDIISPEDTRRKVAMALEILVNKRELRPAKKHGLGPV